MISLAPLLLPKTIPKIPLEYFGRFAPTEHCKTRALWQHFYVLRDMKRFCVPPKWLDLKCVV